MMRKLAVLVLVGFLLFSLVGCGGGGGGGTAKGDTLTEEQREKLINQISSGGPLLDSLDFYLTLLPDYSLKTVSVKLPVTKSAILPALKALQSLRQTKGITEARNWTGPDNDGWYTLTYTETVTPPDGDYINTDVLRIRYFADRRRFEIVETYSETYSSTDTPGFTQRISGYLILSGDPFGSGQCYPTQGSLTVSDEAPDAVNPNLTNVFRQSISFSNLQLVTLSSSQAVVPQILVGKLDMYFTIIIQSESININDFHFFQVQTSVNGATTDTPVLAINGWYDMPDDGQGSINFNNTYPLYNIL